MFFKKKKLKNDHPTHWTLGWDLSLELGFDDGTYLPRNAGLLLYPMYFDENGEPIKESLPIGKTGKTKMKSNKNTRTGG